MPQQRARPGHGAARDAGNASARDALEHPQMLFRFQRDPLEAALHTNLAPADSKSPARTPPKRRAGR
jgi:hypothetical protein